MRINAKVHNGEYGGKQVLNETFPLVKGFSVGKNGGFITVDGKNIEMDVERQYQAPASYPRKALRLAKEGYVIVEFDVSADGDVIDPFVLEGEPAGLFDRAAMKSIRKWIYQPPIYEGVPVQVNDVQVKLSFRVQ